MAAEDVLNCFEIDKKFVNDLYEDIVLIQNKIAELAKKRNNSGSETKRKGKKLSSVNENNTFTVVKDVTENNPKALQIKKEKMSTTLKETEDLMPAPKIPPLRKRNVKEAKLNDSEQPRRSSRMKKSSVKESMSSDSDIIIQNSTIPTIDLSNQKESPVQRITRSKVKIKSTVPSKGEEENNENNQEISLKKLEIKQSDKKSKCENYPIEQEQPTQLNSTITLKNPTVLQENLTHNVENLTIQEVGPAKELEKKLIPAGKNAPVFSPYSRTPLRQKVMAFEKLNSKSASVTQTKSPSVILSTNAQKMLKASQKDLRQREKLKMEREQEAAKKKEALLKSLAEKNKKKNAEKQSKAQYLRELKEKEVEKKLEVQKLKEERYNKSMAEREEKEKKKKEEAEKKRILVKKRAEEQRKLEIAGQSPKKPIYLVTPPPLLPTSDCYDSDDEGFKNNKKVPSWMRSSALHENQLVAQTVGETLKNSFFCVHHQTINLKEIFEDIDVKKLKRNSSAIWKKPPRYTNIHDVIFSEDEDST